MPRTPGRQPAPHRSRARLARSQMVATGLPRALQHLSQRLRRESNRGPPGHRVSTPGGPGSTGGRNPLSDTTDVMSEVSSEGAEAGATRRRRSPGLSGMLLSELQGMASSLGISGTARMRKGELVAAIQERQAGGSAGSGNSRPAKSEDWPSATEGVAA